jgi:hypothetical protein
MFPENRLPTHPGEILSIVAVHKVTLERAKVVADKGRVMI